MKLTVLTADERIVSLDVEPDELVENLKAILEVETQVPLVQQQLLFNGKEVQNTMRLNAAGVGEDDLLMLVSAPTPSSAGGPAPSDLAFNPDGSAVNPIALQRHLRGDPNVMSQLQQAILSDDTEVLQMLLRRQHQHRVELQRRQQQELDLMNADPFDVDAQRKIEEAIRQKNVDENWEAAIEYNPEAFARVIMLYVDMEVNGVPLKAFVDSGAQSTIISKTCAERCGLLRLMDRRYVGIAKGVGQSEIVGRIHVAPLKIGTNFYPCSFTVLDQPDLEFIFGLDMLRKHQCSIDMKDNVLRVGGGEIAVPFLQERDLPIHLHDDKRLEELPPATELSQTEAKVQRLVELGFDRRTVIQALTLFNGNEEQAASYLFGGF
ncbi:unnamed protein product [Sphagnum jensenii]|uniref:DNA damage-inducible protein 1 n=1 Tax=Sphagnum jensenii TaxID=128206 RepID=A0ABP0VU28_9BRYO